ncbi:helix-turn-helix domain-containing protein [Micromonospora sp. NPDC049559]|uniref:winged helix-turn-helix transcriptional regulator n=1 Tax=Micromonospora sp. NPDC049559 TaxID=3155923 RepID=UPI003412AA5D
MRSYRQYCPIARALDLVGERWTLLVVRELLLQGPCRFTDLRNGLPGIASNLLSGRLKELEEAGLISREEAPPPIATTLYALSPTGRALEPVLRALGMWGLQLLADEREEDAFQPHWLAYASSCFTTDGDPGAPPVVIQLLASGRAALIEIGPGGVQARVGRALAPDLTLEGRPRSALDLLTGAIDLAAATRAGLIATGNLDVLTRLRPIASIGRPPVEN